MLYDVFICHASEDKDIFVRPLAEALRAENITVWYDEFTLKLGDSIRRSLDKGLKQSRFGAVVFSKPFFNKNWPQYELDGLAEREIKGRDKVVLPIWHDVNHDDVMQYSPSLAGRKAVSTDQGLQAVVDAVLDVVHPQQSPLIVARDTLIEWGLTPPVITDEYWLEVTEASNRLPGFGAAIPEESSWYRWSFPLPDRGNDAKEWGEKLAWTAMQMYWVDAADRIPISPCTPPNVVLEFIHGHAGLLETCQTFPRLTAEYAPQLTIPGMGDELESIFDEQYKESLAKHEEMRRANSPQGSALTTDRACPLCDDEWVLRHPTFGNYKSVHVAQEYFNGEMFGPQVSPYHAFDHAIWLLSEVSNWLPPRIHDYLLEGLVNWISWAWGELASSSDRGGEWATNGALLGHICKCLENRTKFSWTKKAKDDAQHRVGLAVSTLSLPESPKELFDRFVSHEFPQKYVAAERNLRRRRSEKSKRQTSRRKKANKAMGSDKK
jgi:hypothetical protein